MSDVLNNSNYFTEAAARSLIRRIEHCQELEQTGNNNNSNNNTNTNNSNQEYEKLAELCISQYHDHVPRTVTVNQHGVMVAPTTSNSSHSSNQTIFTTTTLPARIPLLPIGASAVMAAASGINSMSSILNNNNNCTTAMVKQKLIERINNSRYSATDKAILLDKVNNIQSESSSDKYYQWFNMVLAIPQTPLLLTSKFAKLETLLTSITNHLNNNIYGMTAVKEEIACTLAAMFINPDNKGKALGLCGPAGVGKTAILRSIAAGIGLPFYQINVGNLADSLSLDGHSFTYTKSEPGLIVRALKAMGYNNGIISFDEVDKLSDSDKSTDIVASLIHITDFSQNSNYQDNYVGELAIDLSNLFFVFTMNDSSQVNKTLLSRIPVIKLSGYNEVEKAHILNHYLVPAVLVNYKMQQVSLAAEAIQHLLHLTAEHKGVRELKELLEMVFKRLAIYYHASDLTAIKQLSLSFDLQLDSFELPFVVTETMLLTLLASIRQQDSSNFYQQSMYS